MKKTKVRKLSVSRELAYIALAVSVITVCAWITVPLGPVPVTLQFLAVALIGGLLGWKRGLAAIFVYILMGLIGIPVFSNFNAGFTALFGPTGGYIFGFLFLALLPALAKPLPVHAQWKRFTVFYISMILGMVVCYFFGTIWFMQLTKSSFGYALGLCVVPFIVPDLIKLALAAFLTVKLEKHVK